MPRAIPNELDQFLPFAQMRKNGPDQIQVLALGIRTNIVNFAGPSLHQHVKNRRAMILDVDPIPYIQSVAVDWHRFAGEHAQNSEWDKLLRVLVWTEIVRAPSHNDILAVGLMRRQHEQIGCGLAGGIRRTRINGTLLRKSPILPKRTIDFVRRHLDESFHSVSPCRI